MDIEKIELQKLGARIRSLRKELGIKTAEEAAFKYGLQRSQYSKYEAGSGNITYLSLVSLLQKMGISLKDFFSEGFE
ncbi:MAG: helix-turn-helix transcriptional regulator [Ignavibacteriaceae bacterium]|nr:helix-turn-helix transcriptional regulator [Ignavibacteriaceae bacterium]